MLQLPRGPMSKFLLCLFAGLAAVGCTTSAGQVFAADPQPGRLLYETHCGTCHYEKIHERKTTKIATIVALKLPKSTAPF